MGGYGDCTLAKGTRVAESLLRVVCTLVPVRAAAGGGVGPAGSQSALAAPVRRLPGGVVVTYIIPTPLSLFLSSHCQRNPQGVCVYSLLELYVHISLVRREFIRFSDFIGPFKKKGNQLMVGGSRNRPDSFDIYGLMCVTSDVTHEPNTPEICHPTRN